MVDVWRRKMGEWKWKWEWQWQGQEEILPATDGRRVRSELITVNGTFLIHFDKLWHTFYLPFPDIHHTLFYFGT